MILTMIYWNGNSNICCLRIVIINRIREFLIVLFILVKFQDTKGETEAVNQRTNNIMVKRKKIYRTNNDLQHTTHKTKE